jgi:deazaflavin-dependent oxidoreductase (nitroreductase family)
MRSHARADDAVDLLAANRRPFAWLTTRGRRTGRDREVELWWSTDGTTIYLISGGGDRSDWVRNLLAEPRARLRFVDGSVDVTARLPLLDPAERAVAAAVLAEKYGRDRAAWEQRAYLIALDVV